jgi:hypothetical protein
MVRWKSARPRLRSLGDDQLRFSSLFCHNALDHYTVPKEDSTTCEEEQG